MKKTFVALCAVMSIAFVACKGDQQQADNNDANLEPAPIEEVADTALQEVTGIAIDGAMNSVYLKVGEDTVAFSYPELDMEHRGAWEIDDTVTVRYYKGANGEDSVMQVIVGSIS